MGGIPALLSRPAHRNPQLLHRMRFSILQALINNRLHLLVRFLGYPSLLGSQTTLLRSQCAHFFPKLAHPGAEFPLPFADPPLYLTDSGLQFSEPLLQIGELFLRHILSLVRLQLCHRLIDLCDLLAHVRCRNTHSFLLSPNFFLLFAECLLLLAKSFLLRPQRLHRLVHRFDLIQDRGIVDKVGFAIVREPQKVPVRLFRALSISSRRPSIQSPENVICSLSPPRITAYDCPLDEYE